MKYTAAAIQMSAGPNKAQNLTKATRLIKKAAMQGAKLITLPEVFLWRGKKEQQFQESETIPGPTCRYLQNIAKELNVYLLAGSFLETYSQTHSYNTSIFINSRGAIIAIYRKIHLFDVSIPEKVTVKESATKKAGKDIVAIPTPLGTMGLSICYDLRFPELYGGLSDKGADVVFVPSAFTKTTGKAHWEVLLRARAIENQCYVIAPNQTGKNIYGYQDYGNSMIIDPWGTILTRASLTKEEIIYAPINLSLISKIRKELPSISHRTIA